MTPRSETFSRRAAVLTAAAVAPVLVAAPAAADVPEGWSDPAPVSALHALLVLGGIPLALFLLITLAVYVPALTRGERVTPGAPPVEDRWFGGPRGDAREIEPRGDTGETGGASGRW